jgi:WD40 repeat protein
MMMHPTGSITSVTSQSSLGSLDSNTSIESSPRTLASINATPRFSEIATQNSIQEEDNDEGDNTIGSGKEDDTLPKWHVSEYGSTSTPVRPRKGVDLLTSPVHLPRRAAPSPISVRGGKAYPDGGSLSNNDKAVRFASSGSLRTKPTLLMIPTDDEQEEENLELAEEEEDDLKNRTNTTTVVPAHNITSATNDHYNLNKQVQKGESSPIHKGNILDQPRKIYEPSGLSHVLRRESPTLDQVKRNLQQLALSTDDRRKSALSEGARRTTSGKAMNKSSRGVKIKPKELSPSKSTPLICGSGVVGGNTKVAFDDGNSHVEVQAKIANDRIVRRQPLSAHSKLPSTRVTDDNRDLFHGNGFEADEEMYSLGNSTNYHGDKNMGETQQDSVPGFATAPNATRKRTQSGQKRLEQFQRMKEAEERQKHSKQKDNSDNDKFVKPPLMRVNSDIKTGRESPDLSRVADLTRQQQEYEVDDDNDEEEDLTGWEEPQFLAEHAAVVTRLRAPRKTTLLISSSADGTVKIWGSERQSRATLDASTFTLPGFSDGSDQKRRVALGEKPSSSDGSGTESSKLISKPSTKIINMWSEDTAETIWGACSDYALRVWSGHGGQGVRFLKGHTGPITAMEGLSGIGSNKSSTTLVGTGSTDRTVRIWDARSKKAQVFLFKGHSDTILSLRWGEGGRSVFTAGKDKTIRIWDTRAGRLRVAIEKHFGTVNAIRAIPDFIGSSALDGGEGAAFVSGGRDSVINLWTSSGDCVGTQTAHRGSVTGLSDINMNFRFRPSAPMLFSIGTDSAIKLWDLRKLRLASEIQVPDSNITKAVWAGQKIVSASASGNIRLWHYNVIDRDAAMGSSPSGQSNFQGNKEKQAVQWQCQDLQGHTEACTDLISTHQFVASGSKNGHILRFFT